jgi:glycosyltransferase involved in cell wall biosynthesis
VSDIELSIVVPALNEEDNVGPLAEQIRQAVLGAGVAAELIVVDDGSTDATPQKLTELARQYDWVRPLRHERAMGQSAATLSGIAAARGMYLATLDADLQNDPADLPGLLARVRSGAADMAQGSRARRKDSIVRLFSSWVGRTARRLLLGDNIRDTGCATRVMRTDLARLMPLQYKGMHRFIPIYSRMLGATVIEVPVNHRPRVAGVTKYGMMNRAFVGLIDCLAIRWMRKRLKHVQPWRAPVAKPLSPAVTA